MLEVLKERIQTKTNVFKNVDVIYDTVFKPAVKCANSGIAPKKNIKEKTISLISNNSIWWSKLGRVDVPTLSSTVPLAHPSITSEPSMHFCLPCLKYLTWSIYNLSILSTLHLPSPFHSATHSPAYLASPTQLSSHHLQCWDENTAFPIYFK